jgi:hypothetical protein
MFVISTFVFTNTIGENYRRSFDPFVGTYKFQVCPEVCEILCTISQQYTADWSRVVLCHRLADTNENAGVRALDSKGYDARPPGHRYVRVGPGEVWKITFSNRALAERALVARNSLYTYCIRSDCIAGDWASFLSSC